MGFDRFGVSSYGWNIGINMNYWITTDTHFGHNLMTDDLVRPTNFSELIFKRLKNSLGDDDILIHLGDVSFSDDIKWNERLIAISSCKKWLVKGNHDNHSDTWFMRRGWDCVADRIRMKKFGAEIVFSHIPIKDNGYDLNIHGHFHDSEHRKNEPEMVAIANDKQILVALELTNYMPVNLKRLVRENMRA